MPFFFGSNMRKRLLLIVIMVICACIIPGPGATARANELGTKLELTVVPAASVAGMALVGYMLWKNRFSQPPEAKGILGYHGPGEFYFGVMTGASFLQNADWTNRTPVGGPPNDTPGPKGVILRNVHTDPGPAYGLKCGYFFDSCPYLGLEGEGTVAFQHLPPQSVNMSQTLNGTNVAHIPAQGNIIWTMALHIVGRYGFFRDSEVPFGRLQPYVGIGPGLGMLYFQADSCKNFSLDAEAGVRYMFTKNIGLCLEYKYFHQWDVQLGVQTLYANGQRYDLGLGGYEGKETHFDVNNHKIVLGLEYHF